MEPMPKMMMMMPMYFWNGFEVDSFLFKKWGSDNRGNYFGALVAIFLMCVTLKSIEWLRTKIQNDTLNRLLTTKGGYHKAASNDNNCCGPEEGQ